MSATFVDYSCVIVVYVASLQNVGPDFYQYL